jgi:hypothetical protein
MGCDDFAHFGLQGALSNILLDVLVVDQLFNLVYIVGVLPNLFMHLLNPSFFILLRYNRRCFCLILNLYGLLDLVQELTLLVHLLLKDTFLNNQFLACERIGLLGAWLNLRSFLPRNFGRLLNFESGGCWRVLHINHVSVPSLVRPFKDVKLLVPWPIGCRWLINCSNFYGNWQ